jgi:hypothetical protein
MLEVADVLRRFGPAYLAQHGASLLPSHRRAIAGLQLCRTPALGGHKFRCDACGKELFAWHSCKNRACPKCHAAQTEEWLQQRRAQMLPTPYFHVVVTVPQELRALFRSKQKDCYALLMRASAEALTELARNPCYCGGTVGILEVLHTWTRQLHYHPHVHCLVTGGGVAEDGSAWLPLRHKNYLVPLKALSRLIRGKFRATLLKKRPDWNVPAAVWRKDWVVHCTPWAPGATAVLDYLARYAFRVALTNCRLLALNEHTVTFRYTDRETGQRQHCTLSGHEFIRRFLQHVLPTRFHKLRYFGLWHSSKRALLNRARLLLQLSTPQATPASTPCAALPAGPAERKTRVVCDGAPCPACRQGHLWHVQEIPPAMIRGP